MIINFYFYIRIYIICSRSNCRNEWWLPRLAMVTGKKANRLWIDWWAHFEFLIKDNCF